MDLPLFILIILLASVLQTATGFGFAIIATPLLLLIYEPLEAVQINLILSLVISIAIANKIKKDVDFCILKRFILGSAVGLPFGIMFFLFLDINKLKLAVALIILLLTAMLVLNFRIKQTKGRDLLVGGLSGYLTSSMGMPGPPLLLYFSGTDTLKEKLRGTTLVYNLFAISMSLIMQLIFAGTNKTVWLSCGFALPLVLLGLYFGQLLFTRINQKFFRILTYFILLFIGVYLLTESLV